MKIKRIALIAAVVIMFASCYAVMNFHYDRLSRYPYSDDDARELILKHLNDDEINYIIEYSLEPSYFIDYINYNDFSIYHADKYNKLKELFPSFTNSEIVYYVELFNSEGLDFDTACRYLKNYSKDEFKYWLEHKDEYIPGSYLIESPDSLNINLSNDTTISKHVPTDLEETEDGILIKSEVLNEFNRMCSFINNEYQRNDCGNITIEKAYVSYDEQKEIYDEDQNNNIPGHDYHQTGLAIDVNLENSIFKDKMDEFIKLYQRFGFVTDNCKNKYFHLRYCR